MSYETALLGVIAASKRRAGTTPLDISGVTGWWDFTDSAYIYTTTLGWPERSQITANADVDLVQSKKSFGDSNEWCFVTYSADKPIYKTTIGNGGPACEFRQTVRTGASLNKLPQAGGASTQVRMNELWTTTAGTTIKAMKVAYPAGNQQKGALYDNGINRYRHLFGQVSSPTMQSMMYSFDTVDRELLINHASEEWIIVTDVHDSGTWKVRVNGGSWTSVTLGTIDGTFLGQPCIGDPTLTNNSGFQGDFAHFATWNVAVSDDNCRAVEETFAAQLGITLA